MPESKMIKLGQNFSADLYNAVNLWSEEASIIHHWSKQLQLDVSILLYRILCELPGVYRLQFSSLWLQIRALSVQQWSQYPHFLRPTMYSSQGKELVYIIEETKKSRKRNWSSIMRRKIHNTYQDTYIYGLWLTMCISKVDRSIKIWL